MANTADYVEIGEIGEDGHLKNFNEWSKEFTETLANDDNCKLNEFHWKAINFFHEYYSTYKIVPTPIVFYRAMEMSKYLGSGKGNLLYLGVLFLHDDNPAKQAIRYAGIPNTKSMRRMYSATR